MKRKPSPQQASASGLLPVPSPVRWVPDEQLFSWTDHSAVAAFVGAWFAGVVGIGLASLAGALFVGSDFFSADTPPPWALLTVGGAALAGAVGSVVETIASRRRALAAPRLTPQGFGLMERFDQVLLRARTSVSELISSGAIPGGLDPEVVATATALASGRAAALERLLELRAQAESSHVSASVFALNRSYNEVEALLQEASDLATSLETRLKDVLLRQEEARVAALAAQDATDAVQEARAEMTRARDSLRAASEVDASARAELEDHLRVRRAQAAPRRRDPA